MTKYPSIIQRLDPLIIILIIAFLAPSLHAAPQPGDVFREYYWAPSGNDAGRALRVGGKVGYGGGEIDLPHKLDLDQAVRAEIIIEKHLCHAGTQDLAISVNHNQWIPVQPPSTIP